MTFQRLNTRAAKATGEAVMAIRQRYAKMESYPMIRQALVEEFGILLSIQQITRIAKGYSFPQLPGAPPTDREVDLTMAVNACRSKQLAEEAAAVSQAAIDASLAKLQGMLAEAKAEAETAPDYTAIRERTEATGEGVSRLEQEIGRLKASTLSKSKRFSK